MGNPALQRTGTFNRFHTARTSLEQPPTAADRGPGQLQLPPLNVHVFFLFHLSFFRLDTQHCYRAWLSRSHQLWPSYVYIHILVRICMISWYVSSILATPRLSRGPPVRGSHRPKKDADFAQCCTIISHIRWHSQMLPTREWTNCVFAASSHRGLTRRCWGWCPPGEVLHAYPFCHNRKMHE